MSLNPKRLALAVAVMALASLPAVDARADLRYHVVLLRPKATDDVTADALARVRGELAAGGFEVSILAQDPGLDVRTRSKPSGASWIPSPPSPSSARREAAPRRSGSAIASREGRSSRACASTAAARRASRRAPSCSRCRPSSS